VRYVLVLLLVASCARDVTPVERLRSQIADVSARARAVVAAAHTDEERRAARHTLVDLQLELADLSQRIDRLQSRP
jgi:hypothetical protein